MKIEHCSGRPESPIMAIKVSSRDTLILAKRLVFSLYIFVHVVEWKVWIDILKVCTCFQRAVIEM